MSQRVCIFVSAILLALTTAVSAQQRAPVQSGEHETFSRLVFPAEAGLTWTLNRPTEGTVRVSFDPPGFDFDLSEVFLKIPRDRLANIGADATSLALDLACACDVSVFQIRSGHIVIDISDPSLDAPRSVPVALPIPSSPEPVRPEPVVLPLRLAPTTEISLNLGAAPAPSPPADAAQISGGDIEAVEPSVPQISIREHARRTLLPGALDQEGSTTRLRPSCDLETEAAEILLSDPKEALSDLPHIRVAILDETETARASGFRDLAKTYLALGWGAEARHVLSSSSEPISGTDELKTIAHALDGNPDFLNAPLTADPACGPATTMLLLISGQFDGPWGSVDEEAFVRFIDRMTLDRRFDLEDRIYEALKRLGHEDVLLRLSALPETPRPYRPPSDDIVAAGTDIAAVRAAIGTLESAMEQALSGEGEIAAIHIHNAMALRQSVPDGPLARELDATLAKSLLISGHIAEIQVIVEDRPDLASSLLATARESLSEAEIIEVAVRLRPFLRSDDAGIPSVANLMRDLGLSRAAGEFEAIRPGEGIPARPVFLRQPEAPNPNAGASAGNDAWLSRDFGAILENPDLPDENPRRQIASLIQDRNLRQEESDDFARAERVLGTSEAVGNAIEALLALD